MIATPLPRSWRAVRIGGVQPLSAILPAVLRQYGLQLPPDPIPPDVTARGESCDSDDVDAGSLCQQYRRVCRDARHCGCDRAGNR